MKEVAGVVPQKTIMKKDVTDLSSSRRYKKRRKHHKIPSKKTLLEGICRKPGSKLTEIYTAYGWWNRGDRKHLAGRRRIRDSLSVLLVAGLIENRGGKYRATLKGKKAMWGGRP